MNQTYKIYREGNYIRVIDVQTNQLFNGATKEVFVDKNNAQKDIYAILNIKGLSKLVVAIPNILKSDGSAYTKSEWETFYTENTGNFNGGGAAPTIQNEDYVYLSHDFLTTNNSDFINFLSVNSGTVTNVSTTATVNNLGIARVSSSTTANSGMIIRTAGFNFLLKGGEVFTEIINPTIFANITHRAGIHDTTSSAIPANGVYFEYSNSGELKFVTVDNNARISTTIATLTVSTWYKLKFTVNSNATSVLAELFNASGVLIASVTQTTNIPNSTRIMNMASITTNSGTTTTALIDIDFVSLKTTLTR